MDKSALEKLRCQRLAELKKDNVNVINKQNDVVKVYNDFNG